MVKIGWATGWVLVATVSLAGCAPRVLGATAILPSEPGDTNNVWVYMTTGDPDETGVYRCYDVDQKPVCKRANLVTR